MSPAMIQSPAAPDPSDPLEEESETAAPAPADERAEEEDDAAEEEEEEEEEEAEEDEWVQEEEEDEEEEEEHEEEQEAETARLAEGYYEIETIRRRRIHKGKLQYLIKWRGWPESANTWEPYENLTACKDFVDAFEKRRAPKPFGKRKRKTLSSQGTSANPSHGKRGRPRRSDPRSLIRRPAPEPKKLPLRSSSRRITNNSKKNSVGEGLEAPVNVVEQQIIGEMETQERGSCVVSAGFPYQGPPLSVEVNQPDDHGKANGVSKGGNSKQAPPSQGGPMIGAKKRKCGSVKRFVQNEATQELGELQTGRIEKPGNEDVDSTGASGDRTKVEDSVNRIHITKIIRPVQYFATMSNDVQQVSITFKALRSDGQEVLVDDKELKANNPLVLISYYEQHLRYNPTS